MPSTSLVRHLCAGGAALLLAGCASGPSAAAPASPAPPPPAAAAPAPALGTLGVDLRHLDRSVRPQDDFYGFVNGTWLKTVQIPADRARYGTFIELAERSEQALKALIEEAAADTSAAPGSDTQKVRDLYASFMDTERVNALGLAPAAPELEAVKALGRHTDLPELLAALQRSGVQTPFAAAVNQDAKQATRYVLYVSQSGLGLPDRDYYLKHEPRFRETREAYVKYVARLLELAGHRNPGAAAASVLALESRLAAASWERAKSRDRNLTYNPKTVQELDALTPGFSWARYLKAVGAEATPAVVVRQPDYLAAMGEVLRSTRIGPVRDYLQFKVLDDVAPLLGRDFEEAHFGFRGRVLQGLQENRPRWKRGVAEVEGALGEVVGRLYVERHFSPASKARMQELVKNLVAAFEQSIDGLEWMGPETKREAKAKLARFNVKIGYPERWRDYASLEVDPQDLVGNVRRATHFEHARMMGKLGKPIDRAEWGMPPQMVNAYYSSTMNEIVFPAAILQPPFFDPAADDATNYGAIGGVIGHEISHGFDDQGSKSDGEGNLRNWWTPGDAEAFGQRTAMLTAQYDAFSPLEGMRVNGKLTLGENIGDLSGLTVAYRAYALSQAGKAAPVIEGFTGDQRFFLGWAQIWRGLYRDDALRQLLLTDSHSPGQFRVNGVVRNMPEFYEAFDVKPGDGAYLPPAERVKIW